MTEIPLPGDATKRPDRERPLGVSILALLQFLQAITLLLVGVVVLIGGSIILPIIGTAIGAFIVLIGLFSFYVGLGLWNLQSWAWIWAMIMNILGILIGLITGSIWGVLISLIIVIYLNTPDTKTLFR